MSGNFNGTGLKEPFVTNEYTNEINITDWDVSNVENMSGMFMYAESFIAEPFTGIKETMIFTEFTFS